MMNVDTAPTSLDLIVEFLPPLAPLLADPTITEIMVNGNGEVYIERGGQLSHHPVNFADYNLEVAIGLIAKNCGLSIDQHTPLLNARLDDGSRVSATLPSPSVDGATLVIRKFGQRYTLTQLIRNGSIPAPVAHVLIDAIDQRKNILVAGAGGSGKTTLVNALANLIPVTDRIITIEDVAEMAIDKTHHVVRFEARTGGSQEITIDHLLRQALRYNPTRIIVGEVRGGEAWSLLQALNTGHQGSLSTIHANSALAALHRLTHCVLMSGIPLPARSVKDAVAEAIGLVVYVTKDRATGQRRVTEVRTVTGYRNREFVTTALDMS